MRIANTIAAGATAFAISISAAAAQQSVAGVVTGINRLNGTIAIRPAQGETVGSNADAEAEEFKVKDGGMLDAVHVEDKVTYSLAESGGAKTIVRLEKQK